MVSKHSLPITRVVILKSGSTRIIRQTSITDNESVDIFFPSSVFSTATKSLSIVDESGNMVTTSNDRGNDGYFYGQSSRADDSTYFHQIEEGNTDVLSKCVDACQGVAVKVGYLKGSLFCEQEGRLVGWQSVNERRTGMAMESVRHVVLYNEEVKTIFVVPLPDLQTIEILDPVYQDDMMKSLNLLASPPPAGKDLRKVTIQTKGSGTRQLTVSYNLAGVMWMASYRMNVNLAAAQNCPYSADITYRLQGWAELENTLEEDWEDVTLTLVGAVNTLRGGPARIATTSSGVITVHVRGSKFGSSSSTVSVTLKAVDLVIDLKKMISEKTSTPVETQLLLYGGRSLKDFETLAGSGLCDGAAVQLFERKAESVSAQKQEEGSTDALVTDSETFRKTLDYTISVMDQQKALVPIVNADMSGRFVCLFEANSGTNYTDAARRVLVLSNTTGSVIETGPLTICIDSENVEHIDTRLNTLRLQEQQFVPLGSEPGVIGTVTAEIKNLGNIHVDIADGEILFHSIVIRETNYQFQNKTASPVELYLEHPISDYSPINLKTAFEKNANRYRIRFDVEATPVTFNIKEKRIETEKAFLKNLEMNQIDGWLAAKKIPQPVFDLFKEIVQMKLDQVDRADGIHCREMEVTELLDTQERYRTNINVIVAGADADKTAYQSYAKELADTEEKLSVLGETIRKLKSEEKIVEEKLNKLTSSLTKSCKMFYFDEDECVLIPVAAIEVVDGTSATTPGSALPISTPGTARKNVSETR